MGYKATYKGPTGGFVIDGTELRLGDPTDVSDDLAKELEEGFARTKGHKFEVSDADDDEESQVGSRQSEKVSDSGGAGGSGRPGGTSQPTTAARGRPASGKSTTKATGR